MKTPTAIQTCDHGPVSDDDVFHKIIVEDRDLHTRMTSVTFRCSVHPGYSGTQQTVEKI